MLNSFRLNKRTPKILPTLAVLSIFSSVNLFAQDTCDIELDAGLTLNAIMLEFFNVAQDSENNKQILYKIDNDQHLTVTGRKLI